ncbi:MAG: peptidoglycan-binding protein [Clostridia bacterium]|nr:peptidoglycan-binding protein [Clostridia bacterium]
MSEGIKRATALVLILFLFTGIVPQTTVRAKSISTNESIVFRYLINDMVFNTAAACGVLANMEYESNFRPTMVGDKGTSYGICQWHYSRRTDLMIYCMGHGYDYTSLDGQLRFLEYELKTNSKYRKYVYNKLMSVPNTAQGAYDAGFAWCYYFEIPSNYQSVSYSRARLAMNTYWPAYKNGGTSVAPVSMDPRDYKVSFTRTLKYVSGGNMNGTDVKYMQVCLRHLGYTVDVDGYYGSGTAAVVKQFQKDSGLTADGVCGSGTWNAMVKAVTVDGGSLSIVEQPVDCAVQYGEKVSFTLKADGEGLTYQWQYSDDGGKTWKRSTITKATYSTTLSRSNANRMVRCIVTDKYKNQETSKAASMKLGKVLTIVEQPQDCIRKLGSEMVFTVKAEGEGLTYQWQLSDNNGKTWRNSSAKTATYAVNLTEGSINRMVRCVVKDSAGKTVTSKAATMKLLEAEITQQPVNCAVEIGAKATFRVGAAGNGLRYQWQLSDDNGKTWRLSSVTTSEYAVTLTDENDGRCVRCIVYDKNGGKLISQTATMTAIGVKPISLGITKQPANASAAEGQQIAFEIKATGKKLKYQWQLSDDNGKTWRNSSTTTAVYSTVMTADKNGRKLRCIVTDSSTGKSITSKTATMKLSV